ncbi:hypothetical protein [Streptomyces sp. NPDC093109]|uniref:hypothetical protein n=1 Tax=Streptomyces sp. NPDC093109 TaxID=3154977 RepID=UPI00344CE8D6
MHRSTLAIAVFAVLLGVSACTASKADGDSKDTASSACSGSTAASSGPFTWSNVRHETKLTGVSKPVHYAGGDFVSTDILPVKERYKPAVTGTSQGRSTAEVITALGAHLKTDEPLAGPDEGPVQEKPSQFEAATGLPAGDYYAWSWVSLVTADFTNPCAPKSGDRTDSVGHVVTWEATGSGMLSCANRGNAAGDAKEKAEAAVARQAAVAACPEGTPATLEPSA